MLSVLGAIALSKDGATLVAISEKTGLDRKTASDLIQQAAEQAGVVISKDGSIYRMVDIGRTFKLVGLKAAIEGCFGLDQMEC